MLVLSTKPLQKLTGTDRQADRQAGGQTCVLGVGNKRNRNLPAETRNLPKPKFGTGFVPAHFQASWFRFRYLVLKFWNFLVNQEVPARIPGLTRNFLVKPGTSWFSPEILGGFCEKGPPNQIFRKVFKSFLTIFGVFNLFYVNKKGWGGVISFGQCPKFCSFFMASLRIS